MPNLSKFKMIEWELTLECNYRCSYCSNGRNECLKVPIATELDEDKITQKISEFPKGTEIFLFGGEPFLHPKIEFILQKLHEFGISYMVQTNFSKVNKIIEICKKFNPIIQVSIHREQIKNHQKLIPDLLKVSNSIRRIDVMFKADADILLAKKLKMFFECVYLTPVSDFNTDKKHLESLKRFIEIKKLYPGLCENLNRAEVWLDMQNGKITTQNKKCLYKDTYRLIAPDLKEYNCSHRINCEICPNSHCFLMDFNEGIVKELYGL